MIGYGTDLLANMWSVKDYSRSRWAEWMRELASLGLYPVDRTDLALGVGVRINQVLAIKIVKLRMAEVETLRKPYGIPIGYVLNGVVARYLSVGRAASDVGVSTGYLMERVQRCDLDHQGRQWFDDE